VTVSKERFDSGMTWEQYLDQFKVPNQPWKDNFARQVWSDDIVAYFEQRDRPLHILTTTEDWCGDARAYVPVVARLAADYPQVVNRLFLRDQNLDIQDQYLKDGEHRSIPTFVVFDADFTELGHFIERPASVTQFTAEARQKWAAEHPEFSDALAPFGEMSQETRAAYMQTSRAWAADYGVEWGNQVVRELIAIAKG
jgi:thiol-disulfide isomerase/thioredoxin